ncbi:glycosyltransferase [Variovorax sp. LjRoot84]|uniref:glycosyltransferase family 4 protein n=1 Tax=Variovorax sp. LjRoot84 TaxID=3342340 RepID=UPI003ECD92E7
MTKQKTLLHRSARRTAKALWWLVTPWKMRQRLQFLGERAEREARDQAIEALVHREQRRASLRQDGTLAVAPQAIDLCSDSSVVEAVGLPMDRIYWPAQAGDAIDDPWSAVRYLIDLWRCRPELRRRFPQALSSGQAGEFGSWLQRGGLNELALPASSGPWLLQALEVGVSDNARQAFLGNEMPRAALPHGLTPPGMREAFRWFLHYAMKEAGLRVEEVWWLFLGAAQNPQRELMRAYKFTQAWQQEHPDGLTPFGRDEFAAWFRSEYGVDEEWANPATWCESQPAALDLRTSYWARKEWQDAHPDALNDTRSAQAFLRWLRSPQSSISDSARQWCLALDPDQTAVELAKAGANVIGHFCYPSGLKVSVEAMVKAMQAVKVPVSLRDLRTDAKDDPHHVDFDGMECLDVTIIHTQPEPFFDEPYWRSDLQPRDPRTYRVAYWYWEFDSIPESWIAHAENVDEVWTATDFVAHGLRSRLDVPVRTLFPGVTLAPYERRSLGDFGLNPASFTFLFTFHMMSVMERKNPLGLIRAFKAAFATGEPVQLVLKTSFGDRHPQQLQQLRDAAADANIVVIDEVYSHDKVLSLIDACDTYISLHRSEGLGLTMAEAMLMGKPVIATGFSGNVDFMDESNSLLVPFELVKLGKPIPPYDADLEWAEPSVEHAAQLMRRVYENQEWAREVGARGKASAEANLSLEAAGRRIAARLEEIKALRRAAR